MGVTGLLQFLKPVAKVVDVPTRYTGRRLGIDIMCLLHRGAVASAERLLQSSTKSAHAPVLSFITKMLDRLGASSEIIVVFDGRPLPSKSDEAQTRRERRLKARSDYETLKASGTKDKFKLRSLAVQSIHISAELLDATAELLTSRGIAFMRAPYEADAQLAFLARNGLVDAVVSEDSDILVYGAPRLLTKITHECEATEIDLSHSFGGPRLDLGERGVRREAEGASTGKRELVTLIESGLDLSQFAAVAALTGCDYVDGASHVQGVGLSAAVKLISQYRNIESIFKSLPRDDKWRKRIDAQLEKSGKTWDEMQESHEKAVRTFTRHLVFDVHGRNVTSVNREAVRDEGKTSRSAITSLSCETKACAAELSPSCCSKLLGDMGDESPTKVLIHVTMGKKQRMSCHMAPMPTRCFKPEVPSTFQEPMKVSAAVRKPGVMSRRKVSKPY